MGLKAPIVVWADIGLVSSFVRFRKDTTEDGFVLLEHVPFNSFVPRKMTHSTPIPEHTIHTLRSTSYGPGIEREIILIYTGEKSSLVKKIFGEEYIKREKEYLSRIEGLRRENGTLKQELNDARSGTKKALASSRELTKQDKPKTALPYAGRYGGIYPAVNPFTSDGDDE